MVLKSRRRGAIFVIAIMAAFTAVLGFGSANSALADDTPATTYSPDGAKLTKVILAPAGTDSTNDKYVFQFAGSGVISENGDDIYSDGVKQDKVTLSVGDTVPAIPDAHLTFNGYSFTSGTTLSNGQVSQGIVQKSITEILSGVEFPHAGVYTYVVTEKSTDAAVTDNTYVNASKAEYILRIRVKNSKTEGNSVLNDKALEVEGVTVEQTKDDNGDSTEGQKIDPTYPRLTTNGDHGKIGKVSETESPAENKVAGDGRGRDVPGFTFANEYIQGGSFEVKKLYDGDHSDRTKYSRVELAVYSEAVATSADAKGACLTYTIEGNGKDRTEGNAVGGAHVKLNGVDGIPQADNYMLTFGDDGWARIEADLAEGGIIRVTGEFGPNNDDYLGPIDNHRMILSTSGLLVGQDYYVIERTPGNYVPTGYVYAGEDSQADPRKDANGMDPTQKLDRDTGDKTYNDSKTVPAGGLYLNGTATGSATTVFVVNKIDETKVTPTGILIDNLPYILMVGVPVAVFAAMFANRVRRHTAA